MTIPVEPLPINDPAAADEFFKLIQQVASEAKKIGPEPIILGTCADQYSFEPHYYIVRVGNQFWRQSNQDIHELDGTYKTEEVHKSFFPTSIRDEPDRDPLLPNPWTLAARKLLSELVHKQWTKIFDKAYGPEIDGLERLFLVLENNSVWIISDLEGFEERRFCGDNHIYLFDGQNLYLAGSRFLNCGYEERSPYVFHGSGIYSWVVDYYIDGSIVPSFDPGKISNYAVGKINKITAEFFEIRKILPLCTIECSATDRMKLLHEVRFGRDVIRFESGGRLYHEADRDKVSDYDKFFKEIFSDLGLFGLNWSLCSAIGFKYDDFNCCDLKIINRRLFVYVDRIAFEFVLGGVRVLGRTDIIKDDLYTVLADDYFQSIDNPVVLQHRPDA